MLERATSYWQGLHLDKVSAEPTVPCHCSLEVDLAPDLELAWSVTRWSATSYTDDSGQTEASPAAAAALPRFVRERVSFANPTWNHPSDLLKSVTVKQHPLTAIESPRLQSDRTS